ncbi:MAG TPA: hypothetical protein VGM88_02250 [Kofleriaceae bacterium]
MNSWNKVAVRFNAALHAVALDELRDALSNTKSSQWIADLVLSVLTYGVSAGLIEGLKLLRSKAAASTAEHLARDVAIEWAETKTGVLEPIGPLDMDRVHPSPHKAVRFAAKVPDAAITAPVSKALDAGKAAVSAEIDPVGSSDRDARAFLSALQEHACEVLDELATPSTTLSDFAIVAQLTVAKSPRTTYEAFVKAIRTSLQQWVMSDLGRLGVEHQELHLVRDEHIQSDPDGIDRTRKLVRVEYDGESRYAVYKSESFTRRGERVGDDSGMIESIVPRELESAAIAQHVSKWGAQPQPYRGWVGWASEPVANDEVMP